MRITINAQNQQAWQAKYGPWAVVTGASDGIGRAIAHQLGALGLNLVLVARRESVLAELASEIVERDGVEVRVMAADLANPDEVNRVLAETDDLSVGLLVASAGFGTSGRFVDIPLSQEVSMLGVNCRAVLMMSHHYGNRFANQSRGGIVLFSSLVAFQGVARASHYAATKAYIQSLAEGLRIELAPFGVDVLSSAPGPIASGFAARANMQMGPTLTPKVVATDTLAALGERGVVRPGMLSKLLEWALMPLPRWGRVQMMSRIMADMTQHQDEKVASAKQPAHTA